MDTNLEIFNEWWIEGKVNPKRTGKKRAIFSKILPYFKKRQAILLTGIRRVGKTTLFYQIIDHLLKRGVPLYSIFYLSFDEPGIELEEAIKWYFREILKGKPTKKTYIFLDEIQKSKNWENIVKKYYDVIPELKFFLTGSASLISLKGARESLAGRVFTFKLDELSFNEFLDFRNVRVDIKRISIFFEKLYAEFKHYLLTGGFPELAVEKDNEMIRNYFKETIFERIIYRDIPQVFKIKEPELAAKLLRIVSSNPGMLLDFKSLASDLKRDWRTIENYLSYLEYSFLTKVLRNYSPNLLTSEKKLKKFYPISPAFSIAIDPFFLQREKLFGQLVETLVVRKGRFFYRSPAKQEVDLIIEKDKEILPVEIKWKSRLTRKDTTGLIHFMRKYKIKNGVLVTKDFKETLTINGLRISCIPLIEWLCKNQ